MSFYSAGITGGDPSDDADNIGAAPPSVAINVSHVKPGDTFWTAVKWIGAGIVLLTAYREARSFYQSKLTAPEKEETP